MMNTRDPSGATVSRTRAICHARPHPGRVEQEIYALLLTYQMLRIAITDATIGEPDVDPDRGSFTITLNAACDELVKAAGVIADTVIDLVGTIGRHVLDNLMPDCRLRTNPRVVKRAISTYVAQQRSRSCPSKQLQGHHQHQHPRRWRPLTTGLNA